MSFRASIPDRPKTGGTARNSLDGSWRSYVPEDDNGNLVSLDYRRNDGTTLRRYDYEYDKNNMRTAMTDNDGRHDYTYDALYQITQATHPTVQNPLERFSYDAAGNRLTDNIKSAYQYNELNQLTGDDSCVYAYDLDGNMTEKISKTTGDTTHFVYDVENRLVEVQKPGMLAKYSYDALGRRMKKEVNGEVTQFRYDGEDLILEMNGNDSIVANYTFGPGIDNPIAMHRSDKNYYYAKDGLSSVVYLTDSACGITKEYLYTAFGRIEKEIGDSLVENPFTFTSRERDNETGNYYYRARYYDQQLGRFFNEDPFGIIGYDLNLYRYTTNNPINLKDPFGLKWTATGSPSTTSNSTVVCDGSGGIKVKLGKTGNSALQSKCLTPCIIAHEESHKADILKQNPTVCKGQPEGTAIVGDPDERLKSENKAYKTETKCLKKSLKSDPCGKCADIIKQAITDISWFL